jgi:23S rRNA (uracil1939-C5)-methyltransferase
MDTFFTQEAFDNEGFCFSKENKAKNIILGALPSEEVRASLLAKKRKDRFFIINEVIKKNPYRVEAPCVDVPRCGGCVFQHYDYMGQLELKKTRIHTLFPDDKQNCLEIIPSPKIFQYRSKMDFSFSQNKSGDKFLGLTQAKGSGRVMNTHSCQLASLWANQVLKITQENFKASHLKAYDRSGEGDLRTLITREGVNTHEKMVILEIVAHQNSAFKKKDIDFFFEKLKELHKDTSCYLRVVQMIPKIPTQFYEMHLSGPLHIQETIQIKDKSYHFKISPSAFFQPNSYSAQKLFEAIVDIVRPLKPLKVLDLFCGTGTIGLVLAPYVKSCVGVEINPYAIFDAKENAELNAISNISFVTQDAALFIKDNMEHFNLVVVDPPRAGLGPKTCQMLCDIKSDYILYVSCNPVTQANDVLLLKEKGYGLCHIQPLDQFPHTNHCENIILLKSKDCQNP